MKSAFAAGDVVRCSLRKGGPRVTAEVLGVLADGRLVLLCQDGCVLIQRRPSRRYWTAAERDWLRENYRAVGLMAAAQHLGRSWSATGQLACKLGLTRRRFGIANCKLQIANWAGRGWCNRHIAAELGDVVSRETIRDWRRRWGLPASPGLRCPRCVDRTRETTRRQCREAGVQSLAEVRTLAFRRFARERGWPEDLRPRAVQILDLLYEQGPQTRERIAAEIGMPWKGSRASLSSNDREGSYLAHLVARGLVVQLPRLVKRKGKGKSVHLYAVAPVVVRGEAS